MKNLINIISLLFVLTALSFAQASQPPSAISVTQQDASTNLISWSDETAVTGETYNVYVSQSIITDVHKNGVVKVGRNISEGSGTMTHVCYTPTDESNVDYYYAVTSVDIEGSENTTILAGQNATENAINSKTIAVGSIALIDTTVTIDGDISEFKEKAHPFIIEGNKIIEDVAVYNWLEGSENWTGNSDLSGNIYVMMDTENMYFGFEVFDESMVQNFTGFSTWNGDAPELNIGLYHLNTLEERHATNFQRGSAPDYQFRLSIGDEVWMHVPWAGYANEGLPNHNIDYAEIVTLPFITQDGYNMEVKIPFADLANDADMQTHPGGSDSVFVPEEGMLIPIDFTLNDADDAAINYEGNFYYYWGDTTSFRPFVSPKWWSWTVIGECNTVTSLKEITKPILTTFKLEQNFPNPFNPQTNILFSLDKSTMVELKVFDVTGRKIQTLVNQHLKPGEYSYTFNAQNLPSGIYFYALNTNSGKQVKKMTLIR